MDLSEILQSCRGGDELAWEALVTRHQARVYAIAYHYVGNAEDARDLAQEVFVRIYQNLHLCADDQMFVPWMIRIARNICVDQLRRRKARPPSQDIDAAEAGYLQAGGRNPEEQWAESSKKRMVYRAVRELTDLNREIILLKEILGLSLEEISSMLQVPLGTVKSRSNRARLELARKLVALSGSYNDEPAT
ncbi:MAG TPA: sigma-70 family RNA polymerase sigma factor [Acidobacteriota bacterium]|nr:sigma-70 family RNA polymerase sigma factor [Acidobacteriota bacterium]